jgi:tetratricopeptide (TPR) repeat protein
MSTWFGRANLDRAIAEAQRLVRRDRRPWLAALAIAALTGIVVGRIPSKLAAAAVANWGHVALLRATGPVPTATVDDVVQKALFGESAAADRPDRSNSAELFRLALALDPTNQSAVRGQIVHQALSLAPDPTTCCPSASQPDVELVEGAMLYAKQPDRAVGLWRDAGADRYFLNQANDALAGTWTPATCETALRWAELATRVSSTDADAQYADGAALTCLRRTGEARAAYIQAATLYQAGSGRKYLSLAQADVLDSAWAPALADLKQAYAHTAPSDYDRIEELREMALVEAEGFSDWSAVASAVSDLDRGGPHPDVWIQLGDIALGQGDAGRARRWYDQAIPAAQGDVALAQRLARAYVYLGESLKAKMQCEEAVGDFRQALALSPGSGEAMAQLAQCQAP